MVPVANFFYCYLTATISIWSPDPFCTWRTSWYEQGDGVRCLVSTAASTFPERPCVDLHGVLGNSGNKFEPTDAVLAGHYNERGRVEYSVVLDGFCDVCVRLKVLVVNVPDTVLMCAARCCVCRRCVDV